MKIKNIYIIIKIRLVMAQGAHVCDCKSDWLWMRSPLEEMKYLLKFIFSFLHSGVNAKRDVQFSHLTRNASEVR